VGKVVMYASVSVDGFIADENDDPAPVRTICSAFSTAEMISPLSGSSAARRETSAEVMRAWISLRAMGAHKEPPRSGNHGARLAGHRTCICIATRNRRELGSAIGTCVVGRKHAFTGRVAASVSFVARKAR
jgi:hypothetical protein